jgi:hypothetical protein
MFIANISNFFFILHTIHFIGYTAVLIAEWKYHLCTPPRAGIIILASHWVMMLHKTHIAFCLRICTNNKVHVEFAWVPVFVVSAFDYLPWETLYFLLFVLHV